MTGAQRTKLLEQLRAGRSLEGSATRAGLSPTAIEPDDDVIDAVTEGLARLRDKLTELALAGAASGPRLQVLQDEKAARERTLAGLRAAARAEGADDNGFADRLSQLSVRDLELVEWALSGLGEMPAEVTRYISVERCLPPSPSPPPKPREPEPPLEVLDQAEPLRPGRAPAVIAPTLVRHSPSSPWYDGSSDWPT